MRCGGGRSRAIPNCGAKSVGGIASRVSAYPAVRAALLERQREFAAQPGGAVLDGRDIGTVIVPDADAKLYVTASAEVRATAAAGRAGGAGHTGASATMC